MQLFSAAFFASNLFTSVSGLALHAELQATNRGAAPKVVYGAFGSSLPKYLDQLDTQIRTWASRPAKEGRFFFIGDQDLHKWKEPSDDFQSVECSSDMNDVSCKMGYLMVEALKRDADWVVVTQTDMYINTTLYERMLAKQDHTIPTSIGGSFGCGVGGVRSGCKEVSECGGYCGSAIYAISKPALQQMIKGDGTDFIEKMKAFTADNTPEDMSNSCALRQAGVPLNLLPHDEDCIFQQASGDLAEMRHWTTSSGLCMMHMATPKIMLWLEAVNKGFTSFEASIARDIAPNGHCAECAREVEATLLRNKHWSVENLLAGRKLSETCTR